MCGFCGVLLFDGHPISSEIVRRMNGTIKHRGPDGEGVWTEGSVGLGHRRLAIIDLTPAAAQPMANETGDVLIVYNGEVYNFQSLRVELEALGHRFHSRSDTETIIHAYEEWGEASISKFNGMFAYALWDKRDLTLILARDRFGVKPVYYYVDDTKLIFASEIKAILEYPGLPRRLCYSALDEYFTFQNVLTDFTLFEGIKILPAGHYLCFRGGDHQERRLVRYWDFDFSTQNNYHSLDEAADELRQQFVQAVTRQLRSDVPIASYLSGGMDSGSITAVARQQLGRLMTFTGGFDLSSASGLEMGFDERANSEFLSNLLKTEHYEMVLHAGDMEHVMPELIWHLEDLRVGQCYPNFYLARLAGKFVKVVLSGAGGDELFGGYPWRYYRGINGEGSSDYLKQYYEFWQRLVPDEEKRLFFNPAVFREIKDHSSFDVFRGIFKEAHLPVRKTKEDVVNASMYFELKTFLHGLLVVEDKMSMAHSLETRVPFLDNDLVDLACRIPPRFKLHSLERMLERVDEDDISKYQPSNQATREGKVVLRQAMSQVIPGEVTSRSKQGFSAPDASWFRGESIDYVNGLLRDPRARVNAYLDRAYVAKRLDEHSTGQQNWRLFIWSVLSFEWWLRKFMP